MSETQSKRSRGAFSEEFNIDIALASSLSQIYILSITRIHKIITLNIGEAEGKEGRKRRAEIEREKKEKKAQTDRAYRRAHDREH